MAYVTSTVTANFNFHLNFRIYFKFSKIRNAKTCANECDQ